MKHKLLEIPIATRCSLLIAHNSVTHDPSPITHNLYCYIHKLTLFLLITFASLSTCMFFASVIATAGQPITLANNLTSPNLLTIDQNNVYWTETNGIVPNRTVTVKKVSLNGGTIFSIATHGTGHGIGGTGIEVDSTSVYWAENPGGGNGSIHKATFGGVRTILYDTFANQPGDIAVDSAYVYWSDNNSGTPAFTGIRKVPINGGDLITLTTTGGNTTGVMAIDNTHVYFSYSTFSFFTGTIYFIAKINKEGGSVIDLASNLVNSSSGITVDESNVYWIEPNAGTVNKVPINGGPVTTLATGLDDPRRIAVHMNHVYWTEFANGTDGAGSIKKVSISGSEVTMLASGLNSPFDIAVDNTNIYWTEKGTDGTDGAIKKLAINATPITADFSCEPSSGPAPLNVHFVNNSSGNIDSCEWDFGDGTTIITDCKDQDHTYLNEGNLYRHTNGNRPRWYGYR